MALWRRTPHHFFTKNLQAHCMDVWCEGFIYFKTVFQSVPEHAIFIQKIEKSAGPPTGGGDRLRALGAQHLAPFPTS